MAPYLKIKMIDKDSVIIWAAGLFEGEGTISIGKNGIRARVEMTDYDVITTLHQNFGGSVYEYKPRKEGYKPSWKWSFTNGEDSCNFLKKILPYLHNRRRERAETAISAYENSVNRKSEKKNKKKNRIEKIKEYALTSLTHKEIAILMNVDRSYVTHVINGDMVV